MMMPEDLAMKIAGEFKGKVLDGFTVDGYHRHGGTSVVLLAKKGEEHAAIKVYAKDLFKDAHGAEMERIERQIDKKEMRHPNLVKTIGAGVCEGYHYLTMEFIGNPTLMEHARPFPVDEVRTVIKQVAQAAIFVHETLGQVHRDIKPDNVAVRPDDLHVTLLDLGLVRPVKGPTVSDLGSNHIKGTKKYAPPELINEEVELDAEGWLAVTYYQLGATLYEMLTGKTPFSEYEGESLLVAIRQKHLAIDVPDAPPDLVKLALDCLTKDPGERRALVGWGRFLNKPAPASSFEGLEALVEAGQKVESAEAELPSDDQQKQQLLKAFTELSHNVDLGVRFLISGKEHLFPNYSFSRQEALETPTTSILVVELEYAVGGNPLPVYAVIETEITNPSSRSCICKMVTSAGKFQAPIAHETLTKFYEGPFVLESFIGSIREVLTADLQKILKETTDEQ